MLLLQQSPCSTYCHCKLQTCSTNCQTSLEKICHVKDEEMRFSDKEEKKFTKCPTGSQTNSHRKEIDVEADLGIDDYSKEELVKNTKLQGKIENSTGHIIEQFVYGNE